MSNVFEGRKIYQPDVMWEPNGEVWDPDVKMWNARGERYLTHRELSMIARAEVISDVLIDRKPSKKVKNVYWRLILSCCFIMKSGDTITIPMSGSSHVLEGDLLDLEWIRVLRFKNPDPDVDEPYIYRISCQSVNNGERR